MELFSIIFFLAVTYGLGFSLARFAKEADNFLERSLMRIGLGLAAMLVLGMALNLLHIPLDWKIFLMASLIFPAFHLLKNLRSLRLQPKFRITKHDIAILIVLLIFVATLYMYANGAFSYPWLEDDDSWSHAIGIKFVSVEKKLFNEQAVRYIDPYPPGYDLLLGVLHQTNDSLYWTLKFFNAFVISLSIIFFFFFANELMGRNKALFATFALASIPAFMSHFIWAISLSIPMYFIAFYAAERINHDKKWIFPAAISIGAALAISPTHSTYFGILFAIYYLAKAISEKSFLIHHALAGFFGVMASFILWWLPSIIRHGVEGTLKGIGLRSGTSIVSVMGTGDAQYTWRDFFIAQKTNLINNPIGIGLVISALALLSVIALIYIYRNQISRYKVKIIVLSLIILIPLLLFLSSTYVKYVEKKGRPELEAGSVPFFEFLSDQLFMVIGLSIMIFLLISLMIINYYEKDFKPKYIIIVLAWMIFAFYAVNAGPFHYKLSPFRVWSILSIPVALLAAEGFWILSGFTKKINIPIIAILFAVIIGVAYTSAYQKYTVNTSQWPSGGFWNYIQDESGRIFSPELSGYVWMKDGIPDGSRVFTFANNAPIIGFDKFICHWCPEVREFQKTWVNKTSDEIYSFLKQNKYQYLSVDVQTAKKFGQNVTNTMLTSLAAKYNLQPVYQNSDIIILKI